MEAGSRVEAAEFPLLQVGAVWWGFLGCAWVGGTPRHMGRQQRDDKVLEFPTHVGSSTLKYFSTVMGDAVFPIIIDQ